MILLEKTVCNVLLLICKVQSGLWKASFCTPFNIFASGSFSIHTNANIYMYIHANVCVCAPTHNADAFTRRMTGIQLIWRYTLVFLN